MPEQDIQQHATSTKPIELKLDFNNIGSVDLIPPNVQRLGLSHNRVAYLGDIGIQVAPKLKELDLSHNRLVIIEGIKDCYNLKELNLSFNFIQDNQHFHLSGFQKLKTLDLSSN